VRAGREDNPPRTECPECGAPGGDSTFFEYSDNDEWDDDFEDEE
jgi:hypothetical protein